MMAIIASITKLIKNVNSEIFLNFIMIKRIYQVPFLDSFYLFLN